MKCSKCRPEIFHKFDKKRVLSCQHQSDFFHTSLNEPRDFPKKFVARPSLAHFTYSPPSGGTSWFLPLFEAFWPPEFHQKITVRTGWQWGHGIRLIFCSWDNVMRRYMSHKNFEIDVIMQIGHMDPETHDTNWIFEKNSFLRLLPQKWTTKSATTKNFKKQRKDCVRMPAPF